MDIMIWEGSGTGAVAVIDGRSWRFCRGFPHGWATAITTAHSRLGAVGDSIRLTTPTTRRANSSGES